MFNMLSNREKLTNMITITDCVYQLGNCPGRYRTGTEPFPCSSWYRAALDLPQMMTVQATYFLHIRNGTGAFEHHLEVALYGNTNHGNES